MFNLLFFLLLVLSIWHIMVQNLFVDVMRNQQKSRLSVLKDKVVRLLIDSDDRRQKQALESIILRIDTIIHSYDRIGISMFVGMKSMLDKDKEISDSIAKEKRRIRDFGGAEALRIEKEMALIIIQSLLYNSAGLIIYLLPFVAYLFLSKRIKAAVSRLQYMPEQHIGILMPT